MDASAVVGGWDGDNKLACFGHNQELYGYNPSEGRWTARLDLAGKIQGNLCGAVTVRGGLLLAADDGTTVRLYDFNGGTGTVAEAYFPPVLSEMEADIITRLHVSVRAEASPQQITARISKNGSAAAAAMKLATSAGSGARRLSTLRPNVVGARQWQVSLEQQGTTGEAAFESVEVYGETSGVVI